MKMKYHKENRTNKIVFTKGNTILLVLFIISIGSTIAASISTIAFKELVFSSFSVESQKAFYAADSGIECALYWDLKNPYGSLNSSGSPFPLEATDLYDPIDCFEETNIQKDLLSSDEGIDLHIAGDRWATTTLYIKFSNDNNDPCVRIDVGKYNHDPDFPIRTTIEVRGVNKSDKSASDCSGVFGQIKRVERGLQVSY